MTYDVDTVRTHFPALTEGAAHFDGPGGSQVPVQVAEAIAATMLSALSNRGQVTAAERRADQVVADARQAVADLLGADPAGVVFGRSMTQVTYDLSRALAKEWGPGDEVVVTRLDHDANIRPWVQAATAAGASVRWVDFDRSTGELPVSAVADALGPRTRLVAFTAASNLLGTRPDVLAISAAAHDAGALTYVDGVHLTAHDLVDVREFGADFYACSPYKFLGPHLGAVAADPALLDRLRPDKLLPSSDAVPERFEWGTLPYESLAGVTAAIDFLAGLVASGGTRRERLARSFAALTTHESTLVNRLITGLTALPGITVHGSPKHRTPTVLFTVDGIAPRTVYERLALSGINAPASHFYAIECSRWLGLGDAGGVRAGIAPYTNESDVDRLLTALVDLVSRPQGLRPRHRSTSEL
ncbi:cysteine desulfurase-like protein [Actinokineospora auranticolor]|uniref:cysteine desulfurase-like protein n=1 Tax=Actinokineospora auranticolor TaxID=155976 RepID=UPI000CEC551F|nr:cysteine desulfurase-like protein [Actinokineospora auranticolor]